MRIKGRTYIPVVAGILLGAAGGYLYYHFVGCSSGSCSITSTPLGSTFYGALAGGMVFDLFRKNKKTNQPESHRNDEQNEKDNH